MNNQAIKLDIQRLAEVEKAVDETYFRKENDEPKPQYVNRASSLGEECERFLVYARTNWQDAEPWDISTLRKFEEGNLQEEAVLDRLKAAGYKIRDKQLSLWWEKYKISGHLDGMIMVDGTERPLEIKSMSPHFFDRAVAEFESGIVQNKWLRRYMSQLTLYCLLRSKPDAVLVPKNRDNGNLAVFLVPLDYEYGESLIAKAERINASVDLITEARAKDLPDEGLYPDKINRWSCLECRYRHICGPAPQHEEITAADGTTYSTLDIERLVARKKEIAAIAAEADKLKKGEGTQIKAALTAALKAAAGNEIDTPNWHLHGKEITVAERVQKSYSYFGTWESARGKKKKSK